MPEQRKKRSRAEWAELVSEYEGRVEDETQASFSRRHGVGVASFRYWLYKLRDTLEEPAVRFVELTTRATEPRRSEPVEVELTTGHCLVRFSGGTDAVFIGEVISTLVRRLEC